MAMVVDLKMCASKPGCRDCVDACHSIHNVPAFNNPKDEVKWVWTDSYKNIFLSNPIGLYLWKFKQDLC